MDRKPVNGKKKGRSVVTSTGSRLRVLDGNAGKKKKKTRPHILESLEGKGKWILAAAAIAVLAVAASAVTYMGASAGLPTIVWMPG